MRVTPDLNGRGGAQVVDIWDLLDRSVAANPPLEGSAASADNASAETDRWKGRIAFWLLDLVGVTLWTYLFLKLFRIDIYRIAVKAVWPGATGLLDYWPLAVLFIIFLGATFFWRWSALLGALYVVFFPLAVILFHVPSVAIKLKLHRSWAFWMLLLNGLAIFLRSLRYHLASKSIAVIAAVVILTTTTRFLLVPSALILVGVLALATGRVIVSTFQSSWFIRSQERAIQLITRFFIDPSLKWRDEIKVKQGTDVLDAADARALVGKIQMGVVATRCLYLWAYKLQQYRERRLALLFSWSAYVWLFLGSLFVFALLNIAVLKIDVGQYRSDSYPSFLAMVVYSLSNFAFTDGAGVSQHGDVAYLLRIATGLFSLLFLGAFIVNIAFSLKGQREDADLQRTVADLRSRAQANESKIRDAIGVSFDEASTRLFRLGFRGWESFVRYLQDSIPAEFFEADGTEGPGD